MGGTVPAEMHRFAVKVHPVLALAVDEVGAVVVKREAGSGCFAPKTLIQFRNTGGAVLLPIKTKALVKQILRNHLELPPFFLVNMLLKILEEIIFKAMSEPFDTLENKK